jgi:prepilin-type N-terminal cleavage/methylation domain-containing protein
MLAFHSFHASSGAHRARARDAGFTLVEMLVACSMIGLMSASTFWALAQLNQYAVSTRLYTTAQAVAQNAIDEILTKGPFNPAAGQVPTELQLGTQAPETAFIYKDPDTGEVVVSGSLTRTITDSPTTIVDSLNNTVSMNIRRATVDVSYRFRNRTYTVSMDTLRAADQ